MWQRLEEMSTRLHSQDSSAPLAVKLVSDATLRTLREFFLSGLWLGASVVSVLQIVSYVLCPCLHWRDIGRSQGFKRARSFICTRYESTNRTIRRIGRISKQHSAPSDYHYALAARSNGVAPPKNSRIDQPPVNIAIDVEL